MTANQVISDRLVTFKDIQELQEKNAQLLEFKCVEFAEELLYGQFKKQGGGK